MPSSGVNSRAQISRRASDNGTGSNRTIDTPIARGDHPTKALTNTTMESSRFDAYHLLVNVLEYSFAL